MAGMRKASVLPEPVRAAPRTSLPERRMGMDLDWMGVMCVMPISVRARSVGWESSRVEKGMRSALEDEAEASTAMELSGSESLDLDFLDFWSFDGYVSAITSGSSTSGSGSFGFCFFFCFFSFEVGRESAVAEISSEGAILSSASAGASTSAFVFLCLCFRCLFPCVGFELEDAAATSLVDISSLS